MIGAYIPVAPANRAASTTSRVLLSILVWSITSDTAPCRTPPSDVKSFWYSISTTAVFFGSIDMSVLLGNTYVHDARPDRPPEQPAYYRRTAMSAAAPRRVRAVRHSAAYRPPS